MMYICRSAGPGKAHILQVQQLLGRTHMKPLNGRSGLGRKCETVMMVVGSPEAVLGAGVDPGPYAEERGVETP
jgi:hypothetical protein